MKTLYIVRHPKTVANEHNEQHPDNRLLGGQSESDISPEGMKQIVTLANALRNGGVVFDEALTSPSRRTLEMTNILLAGTQPHERTQVTMLNALKERNLGAISGMTMQQIVTAFPELREHAEHDPHFRQLRETFAKREGIENYTDVEARLRTELGPILQDRTPSTILIVSHKHTIRCLLHWLLDMADVATRDNVLDLDIPNAYPIILERIVPNTPRFVMRSGLPPEWYGRPVPWPPDTDAYLPQHLEEPYMKLYAEKGMVEPELPDVRFGKN